MAVTSQSLTITTTRQALTIDTAEDLQYGVTVWLYGEYHGSSNKVAIGGPDVTLSTGVHIYGGEKFGPISLAHGETIHAISDSESGIELRIFATGA